MTAGAEQLGDSSENRPSKEVSYPLSITLREDWIDYYRAADPEHSGNFFSQAQEAFLSETILLAKSAEIELTTATTDEERQILQERISNGMLARTALFEVNIPFALYFARESVGISHPVSTEKIRSSKFQKLNGSSAGTYAPLSSLKSSFASLEDREQSALEALWESTARFIPHESKAKFITFAAWSIQQKIDRNSQKEEHNGLRLPPSSHNEIGTYFRNNPYVDTNPIPEDIKTLIERSAYIDFDRVKPAVDTTSIDDTSEEDEIQSIAELYGEDLVDGELFEITNDSLGDTIEKVLETLSEREAGVIKMRFGIGLPEPCTYEEVANAYGVTRERIRQIESKTMEKLRHPSRSKHLKPYMYTDGEVDTRAVLSLSDERYVDIQYYGRSGDGSIANLGRIATIQASTHRFRQRAEMAITIEEYRENEEKKAWQAYPGESWDEPVRINYQYEAEPKTSVDLHQFERIKHILLESQAYHYQTSFGEAVNTPAPIALLKRIDLLTDGGYILRSQIDSLYFDFIAEALPKLCAKLETDFSVSRTKNLFDTLYKKYVYDEIDDEDLDLEPQALLSELLVQEVKNIFEAIYSQRK